MNKTRNDVYEGRFNQEDWYVVTVNGQPFDHRPSLKVRNHSPDGFAFGYGGSGPAQLALAILLRESDRATAEKLYQAFKFQVISRFESEGFKLTSEEVRAWLANQNKEATAC
jgi:hypothetical protein